MDGGSLHLRSFRTVTSRRRVTSVSFPISPAWMVAGAAGAMHAAGVTLGSLSTGFADLMNMGVDGSAAAAEANAADAEGPASAHDPASRLRNLGKSLFEALKKAGWPADKPLELKLDATGQMSTEELPPELKNFVERFLQENPDYSSQFEQLASELRRQYEYPDTAGYGLTSNTANGSWRFTLSEQPTKWSWSSV